MICEDEFQATYLYYFLRFNREEIVSFANGGAQPNLSKALIENILILHPNTELLSIHPFNKFLQLRRYYEGENIALKKIQKLILSKMTKVETENEVVV